ncbi:MAG: hypothetical protein HYS16_00585 [Deltaproteobacteria bacterium]|nr:MAG: hypothetical protein HYS16_00585 [Deltaproteobacteria bacterium]
MKSYSEWIQKLSLKALPNVIGILCQSSFLTKKTITDLQNKYLPNNVEFNYDFLDENSPMEKILHAAKFRPIQSDFRLIAAPISNSFCSDQLDLLQKYLQNPIKTTLLVFLFKKTSYPLKIIETLAMSNTLFNFNKLTKYETIQIIKAEASTAHIQISSSISSMIQSNIGNNLDLLRNTLDTPHFSHNESNSLLETPINMLQSSTQTPSAIDCLDSLLVRQYVSSLRQLSTFPIPKNSIALLSLLTWHCKSLLQAKINPFFNSKISNTLKRYPSNKFKSKTLIQILKHLIQAEKNTKALAYSKEHIFQVFLYTL